MPTSASVCVKFPAFTTSKCGARSSGIHDYAQILSYPMPLLEVIAKGDGKLTEEYTKLVNDGLAEICAKLPDEFSAGSRKPATGRCPMAACVKRSAR